MIYYTSKRFIDGKVRLVIVDENGKIVNRKPKKEELKGLEEETYVKKERYTAAEKKNRQKGRFWKKVDIKDKDSCWEWKGAIHHSGYAFVLYDEKIRGAHIVAYIIEYGDIPEGKWVLHRCDNKKCVNPNHLFLGTRQDNVNDMINKYGHTKCIHKGKDNGMSKLTWDDVHSIRKKYATRTISMDQLAKEYYGVSKATVYEIIHNNVWKDENYKIPDWLKK